MSIQISRSTLLNNIPQRKIEEALKETLSNCDTCKKSILSEACHRCRTFNEVLRRYSDSNIPVRYWNLEMEDFQGNPILLDVWKEVTKDLKKTYRNGSSFLLAGNHGTGKSMLVCNILKRTACKGYTAHYCTLSDIVSVLLSKTREEAIIARQQLLTIDFLAIDEFDPRFMGSEQAADLFGKVMEEILRPRMQNCLPLFICTNSPNITETFQGAIKQSLLSLLNYVKKIPVIGEDFRTKESND